MTMRDFRTNGSRQSIPNRTQRMDHLSKRRNIFFNLLLYSLLIALPAFLDISCRKAPSPVPDGGEEPEVVDSTLTVLHLQNSSRYAVEDVQILIYKSDGTRELEQLLRLDEFTETVEVVTTEGEKLVAAVANCGKALSPVALGRYDSLSEFGYDFSDENCEAPVMSGECRTRGNMGEISLVPLLCEVVIESVANCLDENYELVENPRVRLTGISGYAGVMQDSDFFPTEIQDRGEWTDLPYDIGMLTQNPGTTLYCYPNETPESSLDSSRTVLEFECEIFGRVCSFEIPLPPFGRGARLLVELEVFSQEDCQSRISVERPTAQGARPTE